jgi:hypothetical protein
MTITVAWRPSTSTPGMSHAAIEGQTRHPHDRGCSHDGVWVWSVCAWQVDPTAEEQPESIRCPDCQFRLAAMDEQLRAGGGPGLTIREGST